MTTPDLPQAAVQAAASVVTQATNCPLCDDSAPCGICVATALAALTAALPLPGETEYAVYCDRNNRYIPAHDQAAAIDMTRWRGCFGDHTVVTRIVTEWTTEAPSE